MTIALTEVEARVSHLMTSCGHGNIAGGVAEDCAWLEACGYPGLKLLGEALSDPTTQLTLMPDTMGLDLQNVSCVFLAEQIGQVRAEKGRIFLRNVRHGLYLLPNSVRENYGIGCPVDPGFAIGGERHKNPYSEKLQTAQREGIEVDATLWNSLFGRSR